MDSISFETVPFFVNERLIVLLPLEQSSLLPSRGIVLVEGLINGRPFKTVIEPDGKGSHWFYIDADLQQEAGASAGKAVMIEYKTSEEWPEPEVPSDLAEALGKDDAAVRTWNDTTPMARWDWIRWIRSTTNPDTRRGRIEAACDKLGKGEKRPCCFNRSQCTDIEVSKGGRLVLPV